MYTDNLNFTVHLSINFLYGTKRWQLTFLFTSTFHKNVSCDETWAPYGPLMLNACFECYVEISGWNLNEIHHECNVCSLQHVQMTCKI